MSMWVLAGGWLKVITFQDCKNIDQPPLRSFYRFIPFSEYVVFTGYKSITKETMKEISNVLQVERNQLKVALGFHNCSLKDDVLKDMIPHLTQFQYVDLGGNALTISSFTSLIDVIKQRGNHGRLEYLMVDRNLLNNVKELFKDFTGIEICTK